MIASVLKTIAAWARGLPLVLTLAAGVASSYLAYRLSADHDLRNIELALQSRADWRTLDLQNKLESATNPVGSMAALIGSGRDWTEQDFARAAAELHKGADSLRRLAWTPLVRAEDRASFEAAMRRRHPDYRILESDAGFHFRGTPPSELFPVALEWLAPGSGSIMGLDITSSEIRRAAAARARDEAVAIGAVVPPALNPATGPIYFVFWPVFEQAGTVGISGPIRSYIIGSFTLVRMLEEAAADTPRIASRIEIHLGSDDTVVAYYDLAAGIFRPGPRPPAGAIPGGYRYRSAFAVAGERWRIIYDYPPEVIAAMRSTAPVAWGSFGLLLTAGGVYHLLRVRRRMQETRALVAERTADLARANDTLMSIIDSAPSAIMLLGPDQTVQSWSRGAEAIFGYRVEEIMGRPTPLVCEEDRATFDAGWARVCAGERIRNVKRRRVAKDGTLLHVLISSSPLYEPDGSLRGVVTVMEDVTGAERVAAQLAQAQKMEAIGQLTGGMAHDFNNLLGVAIGNLELLQESLGATGEPAELCAAAFDAAMRGSELVQRLLAFARRQALQPAAIDLAGVVSGITPMLARTLGERIAITTTLAPDLVEALADRAQLESAIVNLAINARDAMPDGGALQIDCRNVTIDADKQPDPPDLAPGVYAVISVSDQGSGIPPELIDRVFDPFFTTKTSNGAGMRGGTGLGLSMVYGFMKQSGGTVRIHSEVGRGTTVRLFLPRSGRVSDAEPSAPDVAAPRGAESILVVEDNPDLRIVANRILSSLGYRLALADCAEAALARLDAGERFDLLFTDVVMPGAMNGMDLARAARRRVPGIGILFTSGFTSPAAAEEATREFAAELIVKPYRKLDLAIRLRDALDGQRGGATLEAIAGA